MSEKMMTPDFLFEVSWEVCNKSGGIHTAISSKAKRMQERFNSNYILMGPDVWRGESDNPEFVEDKGLFSAWRDAVAGEGLSIRVGRWKVDGLPIAIIVDFTPFISQKDEIFKIMWERFKLDSISGTWDYVEPVLFGYAAGKVIESFSRFNAGSADLVLAHFHEWLSGAGVLYLKDNVPQVATMFTAHATVAGRTLAERNHPLYKEFEKFDINVLAKEMNIVSKISLEKLAAANADVVTTVSGISARECRRFLERDPDLMTPNGFENSLVPDEKALRAKRAEARGKLRAVSEALLGRRLDDEVMFAGHSGRYEIRSKGIDLYIDSIAALRDRILPKRELVAFIMVPAGQTGPRRDLKDVLFGSAGDIPAGNRIATHYLHDYEYDPVLCMLKERGLHNEPDDRVNIVFVPCYLNGNDGIFNMPYYDLLSGFDVMVFPSYYEPWGYSPMESIAFGVPAITTSLCGYGQWICMNHKGDRPALMVIERTDDNYHRVAEEIAEAITAISAFDDGVSARVRENARIISELTDWAKQLEHYGRAWHSALEKSWPRISQLPSTEKAELAGAVYKTTFRHAPKWKTIFVHKNLPDRLSALDELSRNLWWSWNENAKELFRSIDLGLWGETGGNPVDFLEKVSYKRLMVLEKDEEFLRNLDMVHEDFRSYMDRPAGDTRIAYFSMEYGLHGSLPIYSGGLGVLAGDYLKEASDSGVDMVAVGLLYRYGYFRQQIAAGGDQIASYDPTDFTRIPARPVRTEDGRWSMISIAFPGRTVKARIWRVDVGRVPLYLLDTDFEDNRDTDRAITHHLYGGDWENRFRQEMLLGIGGIRALKIIGVKPSVYHCNEGHAAFIGIERLNRYVNDKKLSFYQALEVVRASTLFTTHTPVPAGHDSFDENLLRTYIAHYPQRLNIGWDQLMNLGKIHPDDPNEKFSMSYLAANLSQEINGVSRLHCSVSRKIFSDLWQGYFPDELHIGYVTNGVHHDTWTASEWKRLYAELMGNDYQTKQHLPETWKALSDADGEKIWENRQVLRKRLADHIIERTRMSWLTKHESPRYYLNVREKFSASHLTIGFARRFATYKRAQLLFRDVERLSAIVNNPERPVQFLFAGKAHPNDKAGQELMKHIVTVSKRPEFSGKILFLQNYDVELARVLVQGVDVWLNTPTRPLEASGTSGMKAVMNGVLNFSVLDGWWVEGYRPGAGWALPQERVYDNQDYQDELDADTIYSLLEEEIVPMFYNRGSSGIPEEWTRTIKNSISGIAPLFTMRRMLNDYIERFYNKLHERSLRICGNDFEVAKQLASWKQRMFRGWENIEVVRVRYPDTSEKALVLGREHIGEVVLDLKELNVAHVGVEIVVADKNPGNGNIDRFDVQELELSGTEGSLAHFSLQINPTRAGVFHYGIRIYPRHPELPHRQDLGLVRWI